MVVGTAIDNVNTQVLQSRAWTSKFGDTVRLKFGGPLVNIFVLPHRFDPRKNRFAQPKNW